MDYSADAAHRIGFKVDKYFGTGIEFEFRFVDVFDRKRAKAQYFESEL